MLPASVVAYAEAHEMRWVFVLTVGVAIIFSRGDAFGATKKKPVFLPVSLQCPAENSGTLELVTASQEGYKNKLRVSYELNLPQAYSYSLSLRDGVLKDGRFHVYSSNPKGWEYFIPIGNKLLNEVCLASESNRHAYSEKLKANRKALALP